MRKEPERVSKGRSLNWFRRFELMLRDIMVGGFHARLVHCSQLSCMQLIHPSLCSLFQSSYSLERPPGHLGCPPLAVCRPKTQAPQLDCRRNVLSSIWRLSSSLRNLKSGLPSSANEKIISRGRFIVDAKLQVIALVILGEVFRQRPATPIVSVAQGVFTNEIHQCGVKLLAMRKWRAKPRDSLLSLVPRIFYKQCASQ